MRLKLAAYIASDDWHKKYNYVNPFHDGLAAVRLNDKWGFVNKKGEEVVPLGKYDYKNMKSIKTYLELGGNLDVILPNFKPAI